MEVKIELDQNYLKQFNQQKKDLREGTLEGLRRAMFYVENISKRRFGTPGNLKVKSGRLRGSIKQSVKEMKDKFVGTIGTNVIYGPVHEFGLGKYPPRPFIKPAIDENVDMINRLIQRSINRKVK